MAKILIFFILLQCAMFAQTGGYTESDKSTIQFTDSLYYGTPGDSVWVVDLSGISDIPVFFIDGNDNDPVDSIYIKYGAKVYDVDGNAVDTTWGSQGMLRDSVWNPVNTIVNNAYGKDYQPVRSAIQLVEFILLNHRGTAATRSVRITILALIKKLYE